VLVVTPLLFHAHVDMSGVNIALSHLEYVVRVRVKVRVGGKVRVMVRLYSLTLSSRDISSDSAMPPDSLARIYSGAWLCPLGPKPGLPRDLPRDCDLSVTGGILSLGCS